jgi:hypothetical protein
MSDTISIRRKSASIVSALGVRIPESLPVLEEIGFLRPTHEIVSRLLALDALMYVAIGHDKRKALDWLSENGVRDALTANEERFLIDEEGRREQFLVAAEAICALAWATRIIDEMSMLERCSESLAAALPHVVRKGSGAYLYERADLRPSHELEQALDTSYCLHWAVREASLGGVVLRRRLDSYVVIERRRALEWITHDELWDGIELDT